MKKDTLLLLLLFLFSGCKCKKEVYTITLPSATTTGVGLVGFLYNNNNTWESISKQPVFYNSLLVDTVASAMYIADTSLLISASMFSKDYNNVVSSNSEILIRLNNVSPLSGTFIFGVNRNDNFVEFNNNLSSKFYGNQSNSFSLFFTRFDTLARIVSGQFSGIVYNAALPGDTLHITDGRFDLKYKVSR